MRARTCVVSCLAVLSAAALVSAAETAVSYNRDVRRILAGKCFACHGPDDAAREADLRLDTRDGATADRDGLAAIVPGDAAGSLLIQRITTADADERMPPADSGKALSDAEVETLRKWIAAGAKYQGHWAFEPVVRPQLPAVKDAAWVRSPIDRFIAAKLKQHGLSPSPAADRYTLIRRVYLDLLGVLPTVDTVDAFVGDARPDAYERMVDAALANPRFGERWGRHWLDQARYADSHGYTNDNERVMWPYRDWVIDAVNRDLPFNQFTIEQLAGDLLPPLAKGGLGGGNAEQVQLQRTIATGFHRNTLINTEGGTKADQFRDEQVKDRVDTTGGVWLGLTVGCAKCHSHKYDPLSQQEYYQLYAFFNSTADKNSVPPVIKAPTNQQQAELREHNARHAELKRQLDDDADRRARQKKWEAKLVELASKEPGEENNSQATSWTVLDLDGKSELGATFTALHDKSLLAGGANKVADFYQLTARSPLTTIRSVRLEVLTHESLPKTGPGRAANGNFTLAEFWFRTGDGRELRFTKAAADHSQPKWEVAGVIDGDNNSGWAINGSPEGGPNHDRTAWFVLPTPLEIEKDHALTFNLKHHKGQRPYNIGRLRLSISSEEWVDAPSQDELAKLAALPADKRSATISKRLDEAFLRSDAKLGPAFAELERVGKQRDQLTSQIASTMVMRELDKPRPTHIQRRGDFLQPGELVQPNVPNVLPALGDSQSPATRLELARWLVRADNPLTPRVRVNRIWMRLFGKGLVETENDFGTQGSLPTHPQLLDWLASEHVRQGWSTKELVRLIVTSATYRQSSLRRRSQVPQSAIHNPQTNRLLWRQNRVRVEGEIVRDLMLSASGMLSTKIGGPSVYPPQPDGVYAFTQRKKNWRTSTGEDRYRRGMYTFFYRSAPYPMLSTFDAPKFNQTCTRRDRSNTPLQSLTVANDASLFELTQALAHRLLAGSIAKDDRSRVTRLFRTALVRPPSGAETQYLLRFLNEQRKQFTAKPNAAEDVAPDNLPSYISPAEAAAWVATARVVMNLDEFITRE